MSYPSSQGVTFDNSDGRGENLVLGILGGLVAAIVGAAIWMGITVATGMHIGFVALGVGALVGFAIRVAGHGSSMIFGICGAIFTFLSCLGGEIFAQLQAMTSPEHDFYDVLKNTDLVQLTGTIFSHTDPIMYLIYAIGIYEGYKFAMRK